MELSELTLSVVNFAYVGALPFIFFRRDGSFNIQWCLTAAPYVIFPLILVCGYFDCLSPMVRPPLGLTPIAVLIHVFSIGLISQVIGTHRVPLALWHQDNDAPKSIITYGPYAKVRHPFYTSFILCSWAGVLVFPHPLTLAIATYVVVSLNLTAAKEEAKLSQSAFGAEYTAYLAKTGRFFPRF